MHRLALAASLFATGPAVAATPSSLQPPAGTTEIGRFTAHGDQIYTCIAKDGGTPAWTFRAPEAWLDAPGGKRVIHHFSGPTWKAADGSTVTGKVIAKVSRPNAVPELLIAATETGVGALAGTRFVQRLDTNGGTPPTGACTAGAERRVPYTAIYLFWR